MNFENKTNTIKRLLDSSTVQLPPHTLEKLRMARTHALNHQRTHTSPVLAWVYSHTGLTYSHQPSKSMNLVLGVLLAACLFTGTYYWQSYTKEREINDLDIAILTDDLPIHVYVD